MTGLDVDEDKILYNTICFLFYMKAFLEYGKMHLAVISTHYIAKNMYNVNA